MHDKRSQPIQNQYARIECDVGKALTPSMSGGDARQPEALA